MNCNKIVNCVLCSDGSKANERETEAFSSAGKIPPTGTVEGGKRGAQSSTY